MSAALLGLTCCLAGLALGVFVVAPALLRLAVRERRHRRSRASRLFALGGLFR